MTVRKN